MPKKKQRRCGHLGILRLSHEAVEADFWSDGYRVRGQLTVRVVGAVFNAINRGRITESALLAFLEGSGTDSNLAPGAAPIDLEAFLLQRYLPKKKPDVKPRTYDSAVTEVRRLAQTLGTVPIHEIQSRHAEKHKEVRLALNIANVSIKQDLITLSEAMNYAVTCGLIRKNPLPPVRGLPSTDRTSIWLRLKDIAKLMRSLPPQVRALIYFLILTGARINEALAVTVNEIDWKQRTIRIPNSKRRRRSRRKGKPFRTLNIDDLGPRLEWLLTKIIKPDPVSGHLFPGKFPGKSLHPSTAEDLFHRGVIAAGLEHLIPDHVAESGGFPYVIPHDCRGTFINHGAIAGWSPQKMRAYTGQRNAASIEAYLDEADGHKPAESLFVHPPLRVRRAQMPQHPIPSAEEAFPDPLQPTDSPPSPAFLH